MERPSRFERMLQGLGGDNGPYVFLILLIVFASLLVRYLVHYDFHQSALLYVGIPILIALALAYTSPLGQPDTTLGQEYVTHSRNAFVVFMLSSVVLFEGFVCVLMFMPLYFGLVTVVFLIHSATRRYRKDHSVKLHLLPLLLLVTSFEGTHEDLSFNRVSFAEVSQTVALTPDQIHHNLVLPMDLQKQRHWFLNFFPMPYQIDAGSLQPGDIHTIHTRYDRWLITNTHHGEIELQITDVSPERIQTRFLKNDSYLASYMTLLGTQIDLTPISVTHTIVTLRIDYQRELDPAWYFTPLQHYGVTKMAEFLIQEVMIRD